MKHNLFTITALSAAMLAGFAHANDVSVPQGDGSKVYTFDIATTIDETLSVDFLHNGSIVGTNQTYEYVMGAPGVPIQPGYNPSGRSLYAVIMRGHQITSNSADLFNLTFRNSQPMTFDDGTDVVQCTQAGVKACGVTHEAGLRGYGWQPLASGDIVVRDIKAGQELEGFYVNHIFNDPSDKFASGTYSEQWKLTITPRI